MSLWGTRCKQQHHRRRRWGGGGVFEAAGGFSGIHRTWPPTQITNEAAAPLERPWSRRRNCPICRSGSRREPAACRRSFLPSEGSSSEEEEENRGRGGSGSPNDPAAGPGRSPRSNSCQVRLIKAGNESGSPVWWGWPARCRCCRPGSPILSSLCPDRWPSSTVEHNNTSVRTRWAPKSSTYNHNQSVMAEVRPAAPCPPAGGAHESKQALEPLDFILLKLLK